MNINSYNSNNIKNNYLNYGPQSNDIESILDAQMEAITKTNEANYQSSATYTNDELSQLLDLSHETPENIQSNTTNYQSRANYTNDELYDLLDLSHETPQGIQSNTAHSITVPRLIPSSIAETDNSETPIDTITPDKTVNRNQINKSISRFITKIDALGILDELEILKKLKNTPGIKQSKGPNSSITAVIKNALVEHGVYTQQEIGSSSLNGKIAAIRATLQIRQAIERYLKGIKENPQTNTLENFKKCALSTMNAHNKRSNFNLYVLLKILHPGYQAPEGLASYLPLVNYRDTVIEFLQDCNISVDTQLFAPLRASSNKRPAQSTPTSETPKKAKQIQQTDISTFATQTQYTEPITTSFITVPSQELEFKISTAFYYAIQCMNSDAIFNADEATLHKKIKKKIERIPDFANNIDNDAERINFLIAHILELRIYRKNNPDFNTLTLELPIPNIS